MKNRTLKFYERHSDKFWLRVLMPGLFAFAAFSVKLFDSPLVIGIACVSVFAIPFHTYLISKSSENKLNQVDYWRTELKLHQWLLNVIKGMLLKKMDRFRKRAATSPEDEYSNAVIANLVALREFYSDFAHDPLNHFRVTYFRPSDDGKYLITQFFANEDGTPPFTHSDVEAQKLYFNRDTSQAHAVIAWRNRSLSIAEKETEITYYNQHQKDKYKSIIAVPVFENNDSAKQVIGLITITSRTEFFRKQDTERHKNYIEQFALRLVFEYCKLRSGI